jgi:hypothetical protein
VALLRRGRGGAQPCGAGGLAGQHLPRLALLAWLLLWLVASPVLSSHGHGVERDREMVLACWAVGGW